MKPSVRFLYLYCNDLTLMRRFYTHLLQLDEVYFDNTALAYKCDALQFTIFQVDQKMPEIKDWGMQPGWSGGTQPHISWSVECSKETFSAVVSRLKIDQVPSFNKDPHWVGYWSYPVRDPAGNTVEITCTQGSEQDDWT